MLSMKLLGGQRKSFSLSKLRSIRTDVLTHWVFFQLACTSGTFDVFTFTPHPASITLPFPPIHILDTWGRLSRSPSTISFRCSRYQDPCSEGSSS